MAEGQRYSDLWAERDRYDAAARGRGVSEPRQTIGDLHPRFHPPYLRYQSAALDLVPRGGDVLELGAGSGMHTAALARSAGRIVALDVSEESLKSCRRLDPYVVKGVCADMAALPFPAASFDVVASAGSLSYGDPSTVNREIFRVLKPGGTLLVVDSLNHNPVYRLNRWRHYRRGERTKSTLLRMPDIDRIRSLVAPFGTSSVEFFGSYLFLHPPLSRVVGSTRATRVTDWLDDRVGPDRYAFKFVLVATDFQPGGEGVGLSETSANLPGNSSR